MGKTALATNIAFNAARAYREEHRRGGKPKAVDGAVVGFFSLEMSSEQLATRMLAEQAEVPSEKIRKGELINAATSTGSCRSATSSSTSTSSSTTRRRCRSRPCAPAPAG